MIAKCFTLLSLVVLFAACSSSKAVKKSDDAGLQNAGKALQQVKKADLTDEELAQVKKVLEELEDIPFNFDSYSIPQEGLDIIKRDVAMLNGMLEKRGKFIRIVIEGHADERGSDEYNLGLGERRANTVRQYLSNVGFRDQSLKVISYGEERPKVEGSTAEAWAANRRVHLVVE